MKKLLLACVFSALGLAGGVAAQTPEYLGPPVREPKTINERQRRQQQRIRQGIREGEIIAREAARLEREQLSIRRQERRIRSDGEVTRVERARLQRQLNQSSRHINRATNNKRDRN